MSESRETAACACAEARREKKFHGWNDFAGFAARLRDGGDFREIPVEQPDSDVGFVEKWFQCVKCGTKWRLIEPDPPFAGIWERVG